MIHVVAFEGFMDLAAFGAGVNDEEFNDFLTGLLEQRAMTLHQYSMTQQRLVKFADVRDLDAMSVPSFLGNPTVLMRLKGVIKKVQDLYPGATYSKVAPFANVC